jgi:hypothetical protein
LSNISVTRVSWEKIEKGFWKNKRVGGQRKEKEEEII